MAVIVWFPTDNMLTATAACCWLPIVVSGTVASVVTPSSRKVTVPVGVSAEEVTVAVKVMLVPYGAVGADETTVVLVWAAGAKDRPAKFSLPFGLPLFSGRFLSRPPQRGDVIVFKLPTDNSTDYIKRLIGLPSDAIQMKQGELYINGTEVPRRRIEDYLYPEGDGTIVPMRQYIETLPNGVQHRIIKLGNSGPLDNTEVYHVPPGEYFMMGDNRDDSYDSRYWGFVPRDNIIGTPVMVYMSIDAPEDTWNPGHIRDRMMTYVSVFWHPSIVRWRRIFKLF